MGVCCFVVEVGSVGDGDLACGGIDGEASACVVCERVGEAFAAVGIGGCCGADDGAAGSVLVDRGAGQRQIVGRVVGVGGGDLEGVGDARAVVVGGRDGDADVGDIAVVGRSREGSGCRIEAEPCGQGRSVGEGRCIRERVCRIEVVEGAFRDLVAEGGVFCRGLIGDRCRDGGSVIGSRDREGQAPGVAGAGVVLDGVVDEDGCGFAGGQMVI